MSITSPAKDTSPIELTKLNADEQRILLEMNNLVRGISASLPKESLSPCDEPWGRMGDDKRTGRVLLLEGGRGFGKTSLLLTLLDGWQRSWKRLETRDATKGESRSNEKLCGFVGEDESEIGQFVRHLPILDFDPIPPDMPLHAWLVHAWRNIARWADGEKSSPSEARTNSLAARWEKVFRASALGFSKSPTSEHGVIGHVLDRKDQILNWQTLQDEWRAMVDTLFAILARKNLLGDNAIIVVPIDDVDLQVGRIAELLPALRLFYHPRVVYLLTADLEHMREMIALSFLGSERKLSECDGETHSQSSREWFKTLARAVIEKSFPITHTFHLKLLNLTDVLERLNDSEGKIESLLEFRAGDSGNGRTIKDWLSEWAAISGGNQGFMTFRRLQQILDATTRFEAGSQVLERLLDPNDTGKFFSVDGHLEGKWQGILMVMFEAQRYIETIDDQQRIITGHRARFRFAPFADDIRPREDSEQAREAIALAMAVGIEREFGQDIVTVPGVLWDIGPAFVWTRWDGHPKRALFLWPFALYPTPTQLFKWAAEWKVVSKRVPNLQDPAGFLAYHWILLQSRYVQMAGDDLWSIEKELNPGGLLPNKENWTKLLHRVYTDTDETDARADKQLFENWRANTLPLMATPEFGLPDDVAQAIIDSFELKYIATTGRAEPSVAKSQYRGAQDWLHRLERLRDEQISNGIFCYIKYETYDPAMVSDADTQRLREEMDRNKRGPWWEFIERLRKKADDEKTFVNSAEALQLHSDSPQSMVEGA